MNLYNISNVNIYKNYKLHFCKKIYFFLILIKLFIFLKYKNTCDKKH